MQTQLPDTHWPRLTQVENTATTATCNLHITPDLPWFDGHFPGLPVLPGVVQTHWACLLAISLFKIEGHFRRMLKLKFKIPVLPGQCIVLRLHYAREKHQVAFTYTSINTKQSPQASAELIVSSGTLVFAATPTAIDDCK